MSGIPLEDTHEFRQGNASSLLSVMRYVLKLLNTIDSKRLRKLVDDKLRLSEKSGKMTLPDGTNENNEIVKKTSDHSRKIKTTDNENELEALVSISKTIISVISVTKIDQVTSSIDVRCYGRNRSFQKCVYIIYDETYKHYIPLCLYNKSNANELETIFDHGDGKIKILLEKFFKQHLKYDKIVQLNDQVDVVQLSDQTDTIVSEVPHLVQYESDSIPRIIVSNLGMDISRKPMVARDGKHSLMSDTTIKTSNINEDNQMSLNMKTNICNKAYEFRLGELPNDNRCLFSSVLYSFDRSQIINIKILRKKVADYIREWKDIDNVRLLSNTNYQIREDYCLKIEEGTICIGEPEREALSFLYPQYLFCVISKIYNIENEFVINVHNYVKDSLSYKKCIIIVYDGATNNFYPLYLYNNINQEEEKNNFKYDERIENLLKEFIQKKLNYDGYIKFDGESTSSEDNVPSHMELSDESVDISNKIAMNDIINIPKQQKSEKRKIRDDDEYRSDFNTVIASTSSTTNKNNVDHASKYSRSRTAVDVMSEPDNQNSTPNNITQLLQIDHFANHTFNGHLPVEQQHISAPSVVIPADTMTVVNKQEEKMMKLETEPIKIFRGRTRHEYKPKKAFKRNGQPSQTQRPSYFADRKNNHWLCLLMPETYLFNDLHRICLEICIITRNINNCIYINPYFKFQIHNTDKKSPDLNPRFMFLPDENVSTSVEGIQKILLYLVVIMLTENELKANQPIKIFQSPKSNGLATVTKYESIDEFKQAYHLNEIRFALTLWIKESREKGFCRHDETQYISEISTQNPKAKVRDINN